ncbi:MAG: prepilin-type N-terminal cleavage/methylation domain-containing protein [Actinomycetota bacterium]
MFNERLKKDEKGFTLIELLVVILIIAILAAIAIPVFLNQRKKGWTAQMESALKNAATAEESYLVGNNRYASTLAELETEGYKYATPITHDAVQSIAGTAWCVQVSHSSFADTAIEPMAMSSDVTTPQKSATCAAAILVP